MTMTRSKIAQVYDADDLYGFNLPAKKDLEVEDQNDLRVEMELFPEDETEEEILSQDSEVAGEVSVSVDGDEKLKKDFSFTLPAIPGAEEEIDDSDLEVEEEEKEEVEIDDDPWKWTLEGFSDWLEKRLTNLPKHSGKDTAGIERVISILEALDREISKATRMDLNGILDVEMIETARDEIQRGIERCHERLEKLNSYKYRKTKGKKKKADDESNELVKTAAIPTMTVSVPLFISGLARTCINSMVSAGHDLEQTYGKLCKAYSLDKREQFQLITLLGDMGYYVRRDRGIVPGEEGDFDLASSDNMDWNAQYYS